MASTKLMQTADGRRYWKISVSRGYGKSAFTIRFYWPEREDGNPVAKSKAERELSKAVAEFERACAAGEVLSRAEQKQKDAEAQAAAAALKTFKSYALDVFMASKEQSLSENARSSYMMFLERHLFPVFGNMLLVDITTAQINKFLLDFQRQGYKSATITKLFNIMNGVFTSAFMDDSIQVNPMLKAQKPKASKEEMAQVKDASEMALTVEQLQYVLACVDSESLKWRTYIYLLADTGMRRGEACALCWSDINFKAGTVTIKKNLQYTAAAGVYTTTPKNGKSRVVDIGADVVALLRQLREEQAASCISQWVFSQTGTAEAMFPQSPTRFFAKFAERHKLEEKCGIKKFSPHLLRHTSASVLLTNGADPVSTAARLGHSDTAVMFRKYAHANPQSIRNAGQVGRNALQQKANLDKAENE